MQNILDVISDSWSVDHEMKMRLLSYNQFSIDWCNQFKRIRQGSFAGIWAAIILIMCKIRYLSETHLKPRSRGYINGYMSSVKIISTNFGTNRPQWLKNICYPSTLKYSHVVFLHFKTHNVVKVYSGLKYKNVGRNMLKTFILALF